jgi:hypothetical protein
MRLSGSFSSKVAKSSEKKAEISGRVSFARGGTVSRWAFITAAISFERNGLAPVASS